MRIRTLFVIGLLVTSLVPSAIFGWWSYKKGLDREFREIKDRHLLLAQNIGYALKDYHDHLVAVVEAAAVNLIDDQRHNGLIRLLRDYHMIALAVVDTKDGERSHIDVRGRAYETAFPDGVIEQAIGIADTHKTTFSSVFAGPDGGNEMLVVRRFGNKIAVGRVETTYFVELGKSVSFGEKGHAAIVDHQGNVLAHPLTNWIKARKNISQVSAVRRMMNGETGIEQFYSPALKGDMIAGLTTVPGPGWGIMIPQPVSEIYGKVYKNVSSIFIALSIGLVVTGLFLFAMLKSLVWPMERIVAVMKANTKHCRLKESFPRPQKFHVSELVEFADSYNQMIEAVSSANAVVQELAFHDPITGLPNRTRFQELATRVLEEPGANGSLIFLDVDNFKEINDLHGHDVGDDFLRACAIKIKSVIDRHCKPLEMEAGRDDLASPIISRIGGDEFAAIIPGFTTDESVKSLLDDLNAELVQPSSNMEFISSCSVSLGCTRYPQDAKSISDLLKKADIAMYQAKHSGKNRSAIFGSDRAIATAAEIRQDLIDALNADQLALEYQPKICARRRAVYGVEAFVRWNHPVRGALVPDAWLPAIQDSIIVKRLGEWVAERAVHDHRLLKHSGHDLNIATNIGTRHFASQEFAEWIETVVDRYDFDRSKLEIEITEDALFGNDEFAGETVQRLHDYGIAVTIDDFGKGFSNFAQLAQLPVRFLKIDRSIVVGAQHDERIRSIMSSTAKMAKDLGCLTVAEGIETLEHAELATNMGINVLQGYFFSKSMPVHELQVWLDQPRINSVQAYQAALKAA